jgi:transcriptional regulator with XRE-family HTH domain
LRGRKARPSGYPEEPQTLGEHLLKRRLDLGLYQAQVAKILGASQATVLNWEKGRTKVTVRHLPAVLRFLEYDPRKLPETLAERLRARRQAEGLSQRELAARLGVDPTTVARLERGRMPKALRVRRALEIFIDRPGSD